MKILFFLICIQIGQSVFASDLRSETVKSIISSLKCEGNVESILGAFRNLKNKKAALADAGITYRAMGEEMNEKVTLKFSEPFVLYGAKSTEAELFLVGDFNVSADFFGDPKPFIKKMNLTKADSENKNDFVSPRPLKNACPPTKRLRKFGTDKFRFGCGWCNGG